MAIEAELRENEPGPFDNPLDDPALPRVLLLGDSISMGYTAGVRALLAGKANVHRPACNCRDTAFAREQIATWLGRGHWDLIHFNLKVG
jgi:acyl-CoA thioesterase-1